jgi:hypothetical protein
LRDALYFNVIAIAREQNAHVLFKFKDADFRTVTADAQNLFQHCGGDEELTGWDLQRGCRWTVRATLDRIITCWIVTTDVQLPLEEVREAAHQRWQIENGIFKRISHLAGTRTFSFKDHRPFFNLLRLFYASLAVLDSIMATLRDHPHVFVALRVGIKAAWENVLSRIAEVLYGIPAAFSVVT